VVLALAPGIAKWSQSQKHSLVRIIHAKAAADEIQYLRLLQRHQALRKVLLDLGSAKQAP
jgi:hypothetical protein